MTLYEMTGHESGIIVFPGDEVMVVNWMNCEDGCLPVLDPMGITTFDMFEYDASLEEDVTEEAFDNALELLPYELDKEEGEIHIDLMLDQNGDISRLFEMDAKGEKSSGTVYTLSDGTKILAIDDWN